ncbi:MAG: PEP-CTERM sorting domain-containing protein [Propionivibrio sp.]|nr:PEP-CTERM sorting domain-containing protein [Propionivibrio sp.]
MFFNVKDVTDVPEPATLALLGIFLAGFVSFLTDHDEYTLRSPMADEQTIPAKF